MRWMVLLNISPDSFWNLSLLEFKALTRSWQEINDPEFGKKTFSKEELLEGMKETRSKAIENWEKRTGRKFGEK